MPALWPDRSGPPGSALGLQQCKPSGRCCHRTNTASTAVPGAHTDSHRHIDRTVQTCVCVCVFSLQRLAVSAELQPVLRWSGHTMMMTDESTPLSLPPPPSAVFSCHSSLFPPLLLSVPSFILTLLLPLLLGPPPFFLLVCLFFAVGVCVLASLRAVSCFKPPKSKMFA